MGPPTLPTPLSLCCGQHCEKRITLFGSVARGTIVRGIAAPGGKSAARSPTYGRALWRGRRRCGRNPESDMAILIVALPRLDPAPKALHHNSSVLETPRRGPDAPIGHAQFRRTHHKVRVRNAASWRTESTATWVAALSAARQSVTPMRFRLWGGQRCRRSTPRRSAPRATPASNTSSSRRPSSRTGARSSPSIVLTNSSKPSAARFLVSCGT